MIDDIRATLGGIEKPGDVQARCEAELAGINAVRVARGLEPVRLHRTGATVNAYVNHGRWVADCVCLGGVHVDAVGKTGVCLDCGATYKIRMPDPVEIEEATEALEARPTANRNWRPAEETVATLWDENAEHAPVRGMGDRTWSGPAALAEVRRKFEGLDALVMPQDRESVEATRALATILGVPVRELPRGGS